MPGGPPTPLEATGHARISRSTEMAAYLELLARTQVRAKVETWGRSAAGAPLLALTCGDALPARLKVVLVGSHHGGSEPAGGEALLMIARSLLAGELAPLLERLQVIVLPNANPDGRDRDRSRNAAGVNLNRDYALLSQPETQAINAALARHRPQVVLDAHESAALKRKTLWREGYLTEFEAQLDFANNPVITPEVQRYCADEVVAPLCARIAHDGLPAQRYIQEILSTSQALTHGGVTIARFRNKAGVLGALSFLLETRLDPKHGDYPSFRNIAVRVAKQYACMQAFLRHVAASADTIAALDPRPTPRPGRPVVLDAVYGPAPAPAPLHVPLRRAADGMRVLHPFADHRVLRPAAPHTLPAGYLVTADNARFAELFARHGLRFEVLSRAATVTAVPVAQPRPAADSYRAAAGSLRVPLVQADGILLPLLLEPESSSNVYAHSEYAAPEAVLRLY